MDIFIGPAMNIAMQTHFAVLTFPLQILSIFGETEVYLVLIPLVYWCFDTRLGIRLALINPVSAWINEGVRLFFHLPRPFWVSNQVKMLDLHISHSFSFPSGHSQIPVSMLGMIGYWINKTWVWVGILVLIFGIGLSRIFLGAHFTLDVIGGWVIGIFIVVTAIILDRPVSRFVEKSSDLVLVLIGFILSGLMVLGGVVLCMEVASFTFPAQWSVLLQNGIDIGTLYSSKNFIQIAGFLIGVIYGYILSRRDYPFDVSGPIIQRVQRFVFGMAGLGFIWIIMEYLISLDTSQDMSFLHYIRGALIGFWIIYGAIQIFRKMGILTDLSSDSF